MKKAKIKKKLKKTKAQLASTESKLKSLTAEVEQLRKSSPIATESKRTRKIAAAPTASAVTETVGPAEDPGRDEPAAASAATADGTRP